MTVILFSFYYVKLRLSILFGFHRTANPLDIKWRWQHWQFRRTLKNGRRIQSGNSR
ncbi:MAG: hypothetical protein M3T96_04035 [Acidobacteriota bacterium]|nr:hypothetical protein [Acidobacteriota bacterium]